MRTRFWLACAFLVGLALVTTPRTASAQGTAWQLVTQPGGYKVAKVAGKNDVAGLAFTCERNMPVLALSLARMPRRNPAKLSLILKGKPTDLPLMRNGNTNVWVAVVKDGGLIDSLAALDSVGVEIDGDSFGSVPFLGAQAPLRTALAGCHNLAVAGPPQPVKALPGATPADDLVAVRAAARAEYGFMLGGGDMIDSYSPDLKALVARCEAAEPKGSDLAEGDSECSAGYIYCGCQDFDEASVKRTWTVAVRRVDADRIDADVRYVIFPKGSGDFYKTDQMQRTTLHYIRQNGQWLVDDLQETGNPESGYRKVMTAAIAEWQRPKARRKR